jgi:putative spermidine/putrescine transport system ATP-binding protein
MPASNLQIAGLCKRYGDFIALAPIDLDVAQGEFLTLLGPSGSGKTTLLSLIAGLAQPDDGQVRINGVDVTYGAPYERDIGMVFQNYALFPHMTVAQNVSFPLQMRKTDAKATRDKVMQALEMVHLPHLAGRYPRELSGGQQQRIALARCMVYRPSIILMDEPLGALDKKLRDQLQGEIKSLHRDIGTTLIYVTHDQEEALNLSDTICLMNHGRIEQSGTPAQLYFDPENRFVADFVGESNILAGTLMEPSLLRTVAGTLIRVQSRHPAAGAQVEVLIRPENIRILHCDDEPTEENVVEATVTELSFVGGRTRVAAVVGQEKLLAARVSARNDAAIQPGETVRLAWTRSNSVVLD